MDIPMAGVDDTGDPWTIQQLADEQNQLLIKVAGLLAPTVTISALSVDVDNKAVKMTATYGDQVEVPVSVGPWRITHTFTSYPANYVSDKVQVFFGLQ